MSYLPVKKAYTFSFVEAVVKVHQVLKQGVGMKSLLMSLVFVISSQVMAAQVELGKYSAVDADTKTIQAAFELLANGTVTFSVKSPDLTTPVNCNGTYKVEGNNFMATLKCPGNAILPEASVKIDISNVTADGLRSPNGVPVAVVIDALGDEPNTFLLKKADDKK